MKKLYEIYESKEDGGYIAKVYTKPTVSAFGTTPFDALHELLIAEAAYDKVEATDKKLPKCTKCKDIGKCTHYEGHGAHFGGSVQDYWVETFCICSKGIELKESGYKLQRY